MDRLRPSFFIIGANKCGTSSLYRYLVAHPNILPCAVKEPDFFGRNNPDYIASHIDEYYSLFPTREHNGDLSFNWEASDEAGSGLLTKVHVARKLDVIYITGEASANTFHDVSPLLLHHYLPDIKLILLIRNPIDRTYSHHQMYKRFQADGNDLGFEVRDFETDIRAEMKAYTKGEKTQYIAPSIYIDKLQDWVSSFGWNQIMIITTERMGRLAEAKMIMREMEDYLEVPHHDYDDILARRFNHAPPYEIATETRSMMADFYKPYNEKLQEYLGYELDWE